jgi:hypothetical protein
MSCTPVSAADPLTLRFLGGGQDWFNGTLFVFDPMPA